MQDYLQSKCYQSNTYSFSEILVNIVAMRWRAFCLFPGVQPIENYPIIFQGVASPGALCRNVRCAHRTGRRWTDPVGRRIF
jgi:hypothetical protein